MKKNPILLVMLALLLAFSFSVIGCGGDDDDEPTGGPGGPGGSYPQWPTDIAFAPSISFPGGQGVWGYYDDSTVVTVMFTNWEDSECTLRIGNGWNTADYELVSVQDKKLTVKKEILDEDFNLSYGPAIVLCSSYTITDGDEFIELQFTGGSDLTDYYDEIINFNSIKLFREKE